MKNVYILVNFDLLVKKSGVSKENTLSYLTSKPI